MCNKLSQSLCPTYATRTHMHTHAYTCTHTHADAHTHAHTRTHMHTHARTRMRMHTHTHTHAHLPGACPTHSPTPQSQDSELAPPLIVPPSNVADDTASPQTASSALETHEEQTQQHPSPLHSEAHCSRNKRGDITNIEEALSTSTFTTYRKHMGRGGEGRGTCFPLLNPPLKSLILRILLTKHKCKMVMWRII